ncbi:MAG: GNAT family N-acetyltransferase [Anaerolineales bacterium]|nr:GNAT family N-acetyltransferase [Anaerolineales bacterium]
MPDTRKTKAELFENIRLHREPLMEMVNNLTETQRTTPGLAGGWSVKDILAHLAAWERLTLERINAAFGNKPAPIKLESDEDIEWMNAKVFAINKSHSFTDVLDDFERAHELLSEKIMKIDKLVFQTPAPLAWTGDRSLYQFLSDNTWLHYAEHLEAIEAWRARVGNWVIREETEADIPGVRHVEEEAFGRPDEANIVDGIRARGGVTLSLVAVEGEAIIGHVLFSPVAIADGKRVVKGVGLGPVAVSPSHQKLGVGSVLCHEGLVQLAKMGHKVAVVLGHPEYYPRFGFQASEDYDLRCKWDVPPGVFMVMELEPGALEGVMGLVTYAPEFG